MAELTVDEAVQRAMRAQDDKIAAIRDLAKGRQALADVRVYGAATKAGWSADELRKIGFDEPAKSRRVRRKKATAARASSGGDGAAPGAAEGPSIS